MWDREGKMTQGGRQGCRWASLGNYSLPTSPTSTEVSGLLPTPRACDCDCDCDCGMGRAGRTLQRRDWAECRTSESPVCPKGRKPNAGGAFVAPSSPKRMVHVLRFALDLKQN